MSISPTGALRRRSSGSSAAARRAACRQASMRAGSTYASLGAGSLREGFLCSCVHRVPQLKQLASVLLLRCLRVRDVQVLPKLATDAARRSSSNRGCCPRRMASVDEPSRPLLVATEDSSSSSNGRVFPSKNETFLPFARISTKGGTLGRCGSSISCCRLRMRQVSLEGMHHALRLRSTDGPGQERDIEQSASLAAARVLKGHVSKLDRKDPSPRSRSFAPPDRVPRTDRSQ